MRSAPTLMMEGFVSQLLFHAPHPFLPPQNTPSLTPHPHPLPGTLRTSLTALTRAPLVAPSACTLTATSTQTAGWRRTGSTLTRDGEPEHLPALSLYILSPSAKYSLQNIVLFLCSILCVLSLACRTSAIVPKHTLANYMPPPQNPAPR